MKMKNFTISSSNGIASVSFAKPEKANALDMSGWQELRQVFERLSADAAVRVIVLSGEGKHFCSGIEVSLLLGLGSHIADSCQGRSSEKLYLLITELQQAVSAIESCRKPVIAAIHGGCLGGGLDIAAACDLRIASAQAFFSVKEIEMGMVADLGILQRLPKLIPAAFAAEMAFTGRKVSAEEALRFGLISQLHADEQALADAARQLAETIASKSPLSVRGTKEMLLHARDHSVADGLRYIAAWNAAMMLSEDLKEAGTAAFQKRPPVFRD